MNNQPSQTIRSRLSLNDEGSSIRHPLKPVRQFDVYAVTLDIHSILDARY
jgi:hypothetical protein